MSVKISVIMPVYNGERFLRQAIESILNQSFTDFELIIINDGSTDSTESIIQGYHDPRIVYVKNDENLHLVKTLNRGIGLARGEYIARMDADDVSLPNRFEHQIRFLESSGFDIVSSSVVKIDEDGKYLGIGACLYAGHIDTQFLLSIANPIYHPTILAKRQIFTKYYYSNSSSAKDVEDYELWGQMIAGQDVSFGILAMPALLYRRTGQNITEIRLDSILTKTSNNMNIIHSAIFGDQIEREYLSAYIYCKSENVFGFLHASRILRRKCMEYVSRFRNADSKSIRRWIDYLTIQAAMRQRKSKFFRIGCLSLFPLISCRVLIRVLILRMKYSRLPEAANRGVLSTADRGHSNV